MPDQGQLVCLAHRCELPQCVQACEALKQRGVQEELGAAVGGVPLHPCEGHLVKGGTKDAVVVDGGRQAGQVAQLGLEDVLLRDGQCVLCAADVQVLGQRAVHGLL